MYLCVLYLHRKEKMENRNTLYKLLILIVICAVTLFGASCKSTSKTPHGAKRYSKQRTRYTHNWNASTSQRTTYYIKKHYSQSYKPTTEKTKKSKKYTPVGKKPDKPHKYSPKKNKRALKKNKKH